MESLNTQAFSQHVLRTSAPAAAALTASGPAPRVTGSVQFFPAASGTLVVAEVFGLPRQIAGSGTTAPAGPFYAFHIHEGAECGDPNAAEPFMAAGTHLNPRNAQHPLHMGDMPPLLADNGYAYLSFFTERFTPAQVVGHTVVVHQNADDFHTQPSGNAGKKIACGVIRSTAADA